MSDKHNKYIQDIIILQQSNKVMTMALLLLQNLILKPLPSSSSSCCSLFIKPISLSTTLHSHKPFKTYFNPLHSHPLRFFCNSTSTSTTSSLTDPQTQTPSLHLNESNTPNLVSSQEEIEAQTSEHEGEEYEEPPKPKKASPLAHPTHPDAARLLTLSVKERKELLSYANGLGKKLKVQQVGKSGVTDSQATAFVENLESNELLKLKIHNNCPGELPDVIKQLEEATGSVAVGQIGRSVILYRPSLTKMLAEEKKKQAQRIAFKKGYRVKPVESNSEFPSRISRRGRRGKSRVEPS